ncbi:polysaccharide deacetylase family protein [Geodermatophilus sp. DSM 45219]|uniref:polysaccharide deacetylase family protein n=1 Tax=Geodermatophilus sp. DSM 45219 TaxID=1881103 RepID=UPI00087E8AA9|nr:polysaccharide deacetylase family protein [Geodermatophilus sp. DSM 45219]SDN45324.1 Polysaccharide deacetylase [Geodermatophilus sp. DSM 45219]
MSAATTARSVVEGARRRVRRGAGTVLGSAVELRTGASDVVLTFDDGPEPGGTDRVLSALADAGAGATFFVLLTRVRRYPGLLDEVVAAGHEVALHGVDHRALPTLPPDEVARLVRAGKAELEDATGRPVRWFRPPYGRQTFANWRAVTGAGLVPVLWGPTTWDWRDVPPAERLAKAQQGVRPGAIVLAHDGFAGPADGACDGPPPQLDRGELITGVLEGYAERGLVARSLEQALVSGDLVRETWFPG